MNWIDKIKRLINMDNDIRLIQTQNRILLHQFEDLKILIAKQIINQNESSDIQKNIQKAEFKVFSQWGDDGIIQYLINKLEIDIKTFVEFGVENYTESNTRFLLINNNWSGLVIDGSEDNIQQIKSNHIYWKYSLKAVCDFINKDNINTIIKDSGFEGKIGLLSIDIDGNDYWVWEAIHVINPIIVIIEYNSLFGSTRAITIPYQSDFVRTKAHYSNLYFGASLPALCQLAEKRNYHFVGTNSSGVNAYFVKKDVSKYFESITLEKGYTMSKFSESRNEAGELTYLSHQEAIRLITGMTVYNIYTGEDEPL